MVKISYITKAGLEKLIAELHQLKTVERPNISQQIAEARDKGDLSENAEYDAAKEAQGMLELKISELQTFIMNAKLIDESNTDISKVQLLTKVKIKNLINDGEKTYTIVGESEANIKEGKISSETPIAKGLLGKKVGDIIEIAVPSGTLKLEILNISI